MATTGTTNTPIRQPRLLEQVRDALRLRHYSLRTERAYAHWVKRFVLFHGKRHPREMGAAEVASFWWTPTRAFGGGIMPTSRVSSAPSNAGF
jgi:hypothetical protein